MNKVRFAEKVAELVAVKSVGQQERTAAVNDLIEAYVSATGERPDSTQLERLTDYILLEDLTDPNPHKVSQTEYPILSNVQMDRRRFGSRGSQQTNMSGETAFETYDEGSDKYHSGQGAQIGADGRSYRRPIRRTRSIRELITSDESAKIRNKERADQYRKDTSPGRVVPYNLRENGGELTEPFVQCHGLGERWRLIS
ncbi:hypothetical protein [Paenibacillus terrigena]|uniref:hypothetical protein n=1 Tax=Paenibacillus terrigena TaxID=369333 RepID=UPI00036A0A77|nr:hypothetical protein [Paenibacillus terrigena]